jgi:putative hydrolase of the HAD superfamily
VISGVSAILLDAGGVLIFPQPDLLRAPLQALGLSLDELAFERAYYQAMAIQDAAGTPPGVAWWRDYLTGYLADSGVPEDRCREMAATLLLSIAGRPWSRVGPGVMAGLRALAALGLPMAVVSNAGGTVQSELRGLGVCYVPGDREATEPAGVPVSVVVDSGAVGVAKPDPAIFGIALRALGVPASGTVLHVGDSLRSDVGGALAAGLQPVHLDPHGFCPAPDGHLHVRALAELARLIESDLTPRRR